MATVRLVVDSGGVALTDDVVMKVFVPVTVGMVLLVMLFMRAP